MYVFVFPIFIVLKLTENLLLYFIVDTFQNNLSNIIYKMLAPVINNQDSFRQTPIIHFLESTKG